jgi:PiT family inorganic phosphate transporter
MRTANLVTTEMPVIAKEERKRRKLVRRSHFMSIIAAWIITVPCAAIISGVIFTVISLAAG